MTTIVLKDGPRNFRKGMKVRYLGSGVYSPIPPGLYEVQHLADSPLGCKLAINYSGQTYHLDPFLFESPAEETLKISMVVTSTVIVCPSCNGRGGFREPHEEFETCSYCEGNRVVLEKTIHEKVIPNERI